jgi:hypothetical protein
VTKQSKKEYVNEMRSRYRAASKKEQGELLDVMLSVCHWNRKYLIRALNRKPVPRYPEAVYGDRPKRAGRPREYHAPEILAFLECVWHASNQACSKRLEHVLHLWLPHYEEFAGVALSLEHQVLILRLSHSTIDRLLRETRRPYRVGKGRSTTKPGTLLKQRIPIKTNQWNERRPGFLEVDTVAHCGTTTAGMYANTLNSVDIASTWVEPRAVWGKGEKGVVEAFRAIEGALPFTIRGVDVDNGSEVLNHHMESYLTGRKRRPEYTRSREYRKNDNAHIEGRNWTHIRQYLGYERFDNPAVVPLMNDLYANEYSLLLNYFLPSVKLQEKERIGSKIIKRHDTPMTPCDRLLASSHITQEKKQWLRQQRASLNPFLLRRAMHEKLKRILRECSLGPQDLSLKLSGKAPSIIEATDTVRPPHRKENRQPRREPHRTASIVTQR